MELKKARPASKPRHQSQQDELDENGNIVQRQSTATDGTIALVPQYGGIIDAIGTVNAQQEAFNKLKRYKIEDKRVFIMDGKL